MLLSAHQVSLAEIERKISELTSQRGKLLAEHEKSMTAIGKEIGELTRKIQETERAEKAKQATPPPGAPKAEPPADRRKKKRAEGAPGTGVDRRSGREQRLWSERRKGWAKREDWSSVWSTLYEDKEEPQE